MESDEAGPTRRVARSRKRSASSLLDSSNIVSSAKKHHEKIQKHTMHSQAHDSFSFEEDWFINSFCSENHSSYPEKSNSHIPGEKMALVGKLEKSDSSSVHTTSNTSDAVESVRCGIDSVVVKATSKPNGSSATDGGTFKVQPAVSGGTGDAVHEGTKHLSLKDRLKQKMKRNSMAPSGVNHAVDLLRETVLEQAQMEALAIQKQGTDVDIGPFYGLPSKVQKLLETHRGIKKFYDWQEECLRLPAVLQGRNLIYSLPTSGGKTLVAEILILRELLCKKKDAILILPYVSIVQEKVRNLCQFALELDFLVEEYAGSKGRFPPVKRRRKRTLYIATLEKAHSLVNSMIETHYLDSLGLVVVDELHMIGEGGSRGAILEAALLKLLHCGGTQIVGMSATLNNIRDIQTFLQAEVYSNNFRPVKLTEYVKVEDSVFMVDSGQVDLRGQDILKHDRVIMFPYNADLKIQDPDHLLGLVMEVIPNNSCLVFCPTKKNCENVALMLSKLMIKHHRHLTTVKRTERKQLLQELYRDGNGQICPVLEYTVHLGIAYHHSGLTMDERRLVEDAYSEGTLCLLTCTSTLAAGVNLPAKRVILRSPYVGSGFINHSQYKQMTGRAGRAGIDDSGESMLITKKADAPKVRELLTTTQEPCHSSLMYDEGKGIRSLLLSSIGLQILKSTDEILRFMKQTLLSVQAADLGCDVEALTRASLNQLLKLKLVQQARKTPDSSQNGSQKTKMSNQSQGLNKPKIFSQTSPGSQQSMNSSAAGPDKSETASNSAGHDSHVAMGTVTMEDGATLDADMSNSPNIHLEVTALGRATFKGSIDTDNSSLLYDDLKRAEESLVLASYLHLLYLVTPYDMARDLHIPWMVYFEQMNTLNAMEMRVASLIGVSESYIAKKASGQSCRQKVNEFVISRFYLTLMLNELWQQKTVWQVAQRFQLNRGFVQNLLSSAASFASCVFHFCQELDEFWAFQDLLGNFVKRLSYCVSMELIALLEIPGVKLGRARQLYHSGLRTLQDVAAADPEQLVKNIEHMPRKAARQIVASAKVMLNEKAETLWVEVESLVALPMVQLGTSSVTSL
ncbi:helicase POLQ-like [Haliotis cracherodii]|uniref:helicase POLQ-like n=1 Tax=Haliotis cracherodii TaxID=6455 RepID=UPI0039EACA67